MPPRTLLQYLLWKWLLKWTPSLAMWCALCRYWCLQKKTSLLSGIHVSTLAFSCLTRLENSCSDVPHTHLLVRNSTCPSITCGAPLDRRRAISNQMSEMTMSAEWLCRSFVPTSTYTVQKLSRFCIRNFFLSLSTVAPLTPHKMSHGVHSIQLLCPPWNPLTCWQSCGPKPEPYHDMLVHSPFSPLVTETFQNLQNTTQPVTRFAWLLW